MPAPRRPQSQLPPMVAIVGPTASGKSALALALAERMPVEIVVADSRQVYRGMDVGTAKPDAATLARIPHHLVDLVEPDQPFTAATWTRLARDAVRGVAAGGALPLVVGGTGLYVTSLVDGYDYAGGPPAAELRSRLLRSLDEGGLEALAAELVTRSPAVAARTDLRNPRRVVRALERTAVERAAVPEATPYPERVVLVGVERGRPALAVRITRRAEAMFRDGLLDETRMLLARGYTADLPALSGIGYREAIRHVMGEWSLDEAIAATAARTRRYARRQLAWFRRDPRVVWVAAGDGPASAPALVDDVLGLLYRSIGWYDRRS
ncbi:MAG: tRNA (adenosine(37)-N6)-dimethylallyltransferase MiaA [Candidatus Limnocylindria bacterium]